MNKILLDGKGKLGNNLISDFIKSGEVFSLSRIGLAEIRWVDWFLRDGMNSNCDGLHISDGRYYTPSLSDKLSYHGVYGGRHEEFFEEYNKGISCSDIQVFWFENGNKLIYDEQVNIFSNLSPDSYKIDCQSLFPTLHHDFWTKSLKGKKVLVVYPFVKTIEMQYQKRDLIWLGEHSGKLPEFDLITYKPVWTLGKDKPHNSWKDSLDFMKDEISNLDFDIALLGCSYYGSPLLHHIKNVMNKSAIYMGGELQVLFGIKGYRWDNDRANNNYNDNWTRTIDEMPSREDLVSDFGAYF